MPSAPPLLRWSSHDHIIGAVTAVGVRGIYSIQRVGPEWILQGVGHDDLSMLAIPIAGQRFVSLIAAQGYAARVDGVKTVEPQVSGA